MYFSILESNTQKEVKELLAKYKEHVKRLGMRGSETLINEIEKCENENNTVHDKSFSR